MVGPAVGRVELARGSVGRWHRYPRHNATAAFDPQLSLAARSASLECLQSRLALVAVIGGEVGGQLFSLKRQAAIVANRAQTGRTAAYSMGVVDCSTFGV